MKVTRGALRRSNLLLFIFALSLLTLYFTCPQIITWISSSEPEITLLPHQILRKRQTPANTTNKLETVFNEPFLKLKTTTADQRVPDLRAQILYHGANCRPDTDPSSAYVRLGIRGQNRSFSVPISAKTYIKFQGGKWIQAEGSEKTSLWIEVLPSERDAEVNVYLKDSKDNIIHSPPELATFRVTLTPLPAQEQASQTFEVGPHKMDNSFFTHMRASWSGKDALYTVLDDEPKKAEKELIYLGPEEDRYAIWAGASDCFTFENGRFIPITPGPESRDKPLLMLSRIDENVLHFVLWNASGQMQLNLDLPRSQFPPMSSQFPIKLLGARSRTRLIAELQNVRTLISSDDWLLNTKNGIILIKSQELLDSYVSGELQGTLLILEGVKKVKNQQHLTGILIDPSRAMWQEFSLPLYRVPQNSEGKSSKNQKRAAGSRYDDEDDYDDDDDSADDYADNELRLDDEDEE